MASCVPIRVNRLFIYSPKFSSLADKHPTIKGWWVAGAISKHKHPCPPTQPPLHHLCVLSSIVCCHWRIFPSMLTCTITLFVTIYLKPWSSCSREHQVVYSLCSLFLSVWVIIVLLCSDCLCLPRLRPPATNNLVTAPLACHSEPWSTPPLFPFLLQPP